MTILAIAEKPSVARHLASWLERHGKSAGFNVDAMEKTPTHMKLGDVYISYCFGHVLEQFMPEDYDERWKKWQLATLPIIPPSWRLKVKPEAAAQVRALGALLKKSSEVIHVGDPDEEGQLLVDEVLEYFNYRGAVRRLWLNGADDTSISRAIQAMKPNAAYRGYNEAAQARSKSDWLIGINMTRGCSVVGRTRGADGVLSVGRVQSPTLGLIVRRELEIRNFKPKDYYEPWIDLATTPGFRAMWKADADDDRLDPEHRLVDRTIAQSICDAATRAGKAQVSKYAADKKSDPPPLPFCLSSLQMAMSSKYGMGAQEVLDAAQSLYEKKLTSYPRTDSEYLLESQHSDAVAILPSLRGLADDIDHAIGGANPTLKSRAWNSEKAPEHHGIIPLRRSGSVSLSDTEKKVYFEVVRRYCLQFWPASQYLAVSVGLACADERYTASGRQYLSLGWRSAFKKSEEEEVNPDEAEVCLPVLKEGDVLPVVAAGIESKTTKKPARYTDGTLVEAMKAAHKFVTNEKLKKILKAQTGIGTEATRAGIIENLIAKKYIVRQKKFFVPTPVAEKLIAALPGSLTSVDMTAYWQQRMDGMRAGQETHEAFVAEQETLVRKLLPLIQPSFEKVTFGEIKPPPETKETSERCLDCGGEMRLMKGKFGWFFACKNEQKHLFKEQDGKPVRRDLGQATEHVCPKCKKEKLVLRTSEYGPYYRCKGEKCATTLRQVDGAPEVYYACPKCKKGHLSKREGKKGPFWSCSQYKAGCKYSTDDEGGKPATKEKEAA